MGSTCLSTMGSSHRAVGAVSSLFHCVPVGVPKPWHTPQPAITDAALLPQFPSWSFSLPCFLNFSFLFVVLAPQGS